MQIYKNHSRKYSRTVLHNNANALCKRKDLNYQSISTSSKDGIELTESFISQHEFNQYFQQFQNGTAEENTTDSDQNKERSIMSKYHVLFKEDAEYSFLIIIYHEQFSNSIASQSPSLFAFNEEMNSSYIHKEVQPLEVQNIHGDDVYQAYLERGWMDVTLDKDNYPIVIKNWISKLMQ